MKKEMSHTGQDGRVNMVDITSKGISLREAKARGFIHLAVETLTLIGEDRMKKGSVLTTAAIAGIQAAKQCSNLVPLCHNIPLSKADVTFEMRCDGIEVLGLARCTGSTGVEMEALTAVSVALLTIYDMCKAVDKNMEITGIKLLEKTKKPLKNHANHSISQCL